MGSESLGGAEDPRRVDRYIERTLEKILRYQREPPARGVDYIVILLLAAVIAVLLLRPVRVSTDNSQLQIALQQINQRLDEMEQKQAKLEKLLAKGAPRPSPVATLPPPIRTPTPPRTPPATLSPLASPTIESSPTPSPNVLRLTPTPTLAASPGVDGNEEIHVLQPGESLWSVCEKYYKDIQYLNALARYNGIDNPANLTVGTPIRIPPKSALRPR